MQITSPPLLLDSDLGVTAIINVVGYVFFLIRKMGQIGLERSGRTSLQTNLDALVLYTRVSHAPTERWFKKVGCGGQKLVV